ncbi:retrovirus-related pol polyprotein from transposon TNT 1-94 [Tanacetum coccineum]
MDSFKVRVIILCLPSLILIKDLGKLKYFLGIELIETNQGLWLSQRKYCLDLLSDFGLLACKPFDVPLEQNLKISNEPTASDPFMHKPLKSHLKIALKVLRYLKGSLGKGVHNVRCLKKFKRSKLGKFLTGNQEQVDDYDFWTDSYASDDDEIPTKQVSQDIMEAVSLTIDEAKLKKMADEMLRQRCTLGDEHQYHIDQMKNFLKSDIVWESRKEILVSPHPRKTTPLVQSCQRDPEAPPLSLINQDLLYLKKGSSGPEKIILSPHKFPAIIFNDEDIDERTSRWVNKCVKKFNPYARYGVEHWKNPHAKIFYIRKQKEPKKPKEIVARRANECIVSITEPGYKNLNKNDIEDMYLLIMNGKVPDYAETGLLWSLSVFIRSSVIWERVHDFQLGIESYQQKVNLTAPTISFPGVEKHKMFSIIYEPVHGIIYKNSKNDKRVMRHSEIHKFCDATLISVLEGLKSYNNDVKYGYVQRELMNDEAEYLKLFEEEIEVRLKYRNQMRRWEMYVNGRPLRPRRKRPK